MEVAIISLVNYAGHALRRNTDERRQHGKRRSDQIDRANMQHAQVVKHAGTKRRIDDGVEHGDIAMIRIHTRTDKRLHLLHRGHLGKAQNTKSPFIKLPGRRKHHLASGISE